MSKLTADQLQTAHEPFVEQHYPRKMSWYAAETPDTWTQNASLWVRENPWAAIFLAMAAGTATGMVASKVIRRI